MKNSTIIYLCCLLFIWATSAQAILIPDFYSATIPVKSYSATEKQQAFSSALQHVLKKVSGNSAVNTIPQIQLNLAKATSLVQTYNYSERSISDEQKQTLLTVHFNEKAVREILSNANQPIWRNDRPQVLIWLIAEDGQGNKPLLADDDSINSTLVKDEARQRGLPVLFPLLDLQDLSAVTVDDIDQLKIAKVKSAASRYKMDTVLFGSIIRNASGDWQGNCMLLLNNETIQLNEDANDINDVITKLIDDAADALAARLSVLSNENLKQQLTVVITGIDNVDNYVAAVKYLRSLSSVTQVNLMNVAPDRAIFKVTSMGTISQLVNNINRDQKLTASDVYGGHVKADLIYKWRVADK